MFSIINTVNFSPANNRLLKIMLSNAGYETLRMRPLPGPLWEQSQRVLKHFMTGVVHSKQLYESPPPESAAAYGIA
ncbi:MULTISPECIES: hypothetical protein [unclassified Ochrobactrum]|uniref:hypothetical protein n=1 Tax=unclassified Ochrobactrum TaxID=239106 RepID=UPI00309A6195